MSTDHYNNLAENFEDNWFFDEDYKPTLLKQILESLPLENKKSFLDLGCGTGLYTHSLVENIESDLVTTGVDFSDNMIAELLSKNPSYKGVVSDLESFVNNESSVFEAILLKEVIHHVKKLPQFFVNLKKIMKLGSKALIITRPQEVEFPFFQDALDHFSHGQIATDDLEKIIEGAGLVTQLEKKIIPIQVPKQQIFTMIRNRFMSTFDAFDDDQIETGIKELKSKYKNTEVISFVDHLRFINIELNSPS